MHHRSVILGLALVVVGLPFAALSGRAGAASAWAPTATRAITLVNATSAGQLSASTPLSIAVALEPRNKAALQQFVRDSHDPSSASYGTALTTAQYNASYAPSTSQVNSLTTYLTQQGFTNIRVESNRMLVRADGTAGQAEAAFNTQLGRFNQNGRTVYANTTAAQVPAALGGLVTAVLGLNDAGRYAAVTPKTDQVGLAGHTPADFQKLYDAGSTPTGSKTSIAIFAWQDVSKVKADLRLFEKKYKLPQVPFSVVQVGLPSPGVAGQPEWDMDTQYSTGIAQNVQHLYLYTITNPSDIDITVMFNRFAAQNVARAGSASFGLCETFPFLDGSMAVGDNIFLEAAAQGQTVFASAGDTGSFCPAPVVGVNGVPLGVPDQEYPASSPYVVAVGGTTLFQATDGSGTYDKEIAWYAGGGGIAENEATPFWQNGVVPPTSVGGKGVPDIAMDADPFSGAYVTIDGVEACCYGGTSLASPLALGVWARLQSAHGNKLGFAALPLYRAYGSAGFHDVILGDNVIYPATPGWDYTTGLGTFDIARMNAVIKP